MQKQPEKGRRFLPITFRLPDEKDRFYHAGKQENVLFAARKRIVSDWARNAPLLHFNYRDARSFMDQNAKRITTNNNTTEVTYRNARVWTL